MSVLVFVSHSTSPAGEKVAKAEREFVQQVVEQLEKEFKVFIDWEMGSGTWEPKLWIDAFECQVALMLVNPSALKSDFVFTEANLFSVRHYVELDRFKLLIVPFGGANPKEIRDWGAWKVVRLNRLQMHPVDGLDIGDSAAVEKTLEYILAEVRGIPDLAEDQTPYGWLISHLKGILELKEEHYSYIRRNHLQPEPSEKVEQLKREVVKLLYARGPIGFYEALDKCPGGAIPKTRIDEVVDLVATFWVDIEASAKLKALIEGKGKYVAINADNVTETPFLYIRQICQRDKSLRPIIVDGSESIEDAIYDYGFRTYEKDLRRKFRDNLDKKNQEPFRTEIRKAILDELNDVDTIPPPILAIRVEKGGRSLQDIRNECAKFTNLRIIVCTGTKEDEDDQAELTADFTMIEPPLNHNTERKEIKNYLKIRDYVTTT